jgi:hypothetical protein
MTYNNGTTITRLLTCATVLAVCALTFSSCKKSEVKKIPSEFKAVTLMQKVVTFTKIETGEVSIPRQNIAKLDAIDPNGNTVYFTGEIAGSFTAQKKIHAASLTGFCVRFTVPAIGKNDYLIIKAETHFPREIIAGGSPTTSLDSNYRYDARYSGKTEYIWFIFDDANPALKIPGEWELILYNKDRKLLTASFDVAAP